MKGRKEGRKEGSKRDFLANWGMQCNAMQCTDNERGYCMYVCMLYVDEEVAQREATFIAKQKRNKSNYLFIFLHTFSKLHLLVQ